MKTIMKTIHTLLITCALGTSYSANAHHSFSAQFDVSKPVTLTGRVTNVQWTNPHIFIHIEIEDELTGEVVDWELELGGPNSLMRMGWRRDSLKVGDMITVNGSLARDGSNLANALTILKGDTGQEMFTGSSQPQEEGL